MISKKDFVYEINSVIRKIEDIRALCDGYENDKFLMGVSEQAKIFLMKSENNASILSGGTEPFGLNNLIDQIESGIFCNETIEFYKGRAKMIEYVFMIIEREDLFDGYPSDEMLAWKSNMLSMEDRMEMAVLCSYN